MIIWCNNYVIDIYKCDNRIITNAAITDVITDEVTNVITDEITDKVTDVATDVITDEVMTTIW